SQEPYQPAADDHYVRTCRHENHPRPLTPAPDLSARAVLLAEGVELLPPLPRFGLGEPSVALDAHAVDVVGAAARDPALGDVGDNARDLAKMRRPVTAAAAGVAHDPFAGPEPQLGIGAELVRQRSIGGTSSLRRLTARPSAADAFRGVERPVA